jgi:LysM domain
MGSTAIGENLPFVPGFDCLIKGLAAKSHMKSEISEPITLRTEKCSTRLRRTLIAMASALVVTAFGPSAAFAQKATGPIQLAKDAPESYTVVRGDTLWDISGRFLQKPWLWPEVWQLNKEQIKNPHWIYPGDVVYLDTSSGSPRLRLGKPVGGSGTANAEQRGTVQPMARVTPLDRNAIPTISSAAIDAFLNRPLVVDEQGLRTHPRIVATQEGRVYLGRGDLAYVRGIADTTLGTEYHIYRQAKPLLDPDTRLPIAWEALYVGTGRLERGGDPATLRIIGISEEIGEGDRLMPAERGRIVNYAPRAPEVNVQGRIVSVYRGVAQAGRNSVVALNVGTAQGVDVGNVLSIRQLGATVIDRESPKKELIKLPDETSGYLLVFRVFDKIAYGLILDSGRAVAVGDIVSTP